MSTSILDRVRALAMNLWWTWNHDAQRLFASLDPATWEATNDNPIRTLSLLATERREAIEGDPVFADHLARVENELKRYLQTRTWFERSHRSSKLLVAYFCAEFAIHESLPQYSGGLGVLAGDHVKSASDLGVPLVGVGLLYHNGFYTQEFNRDGSTRVIYPRIDFAQTPLTDTKTIIQVPMGKGTIAAKIWQQQVGRVQLVLLDTNIPANSSHDRALTKHLYGGDREYRIRQEILLGVGGVIALHKLNIRPTVYHLNEGHAAFCALERLRRLQKSGQSLERACDRVRASTVFTTHTPVPAGNDRFAPRLALKYLHQYAKDFGWTDQQLLGLGREEPHDRNEEFCMTVLALKLSNYRNGVATLHGDTSRKMWARTFNTNDSNKVPISHITNGVHTQTWLPAEMTPLYDKFLTPQWLGAGPKQSWWERAKAIPNAELWRVQQTLRSKLVCFARGRLTDQLIRQHASVEDLAAARTALSPHALTIGFARRFATYKRAPLIFRDRKRLASILNDAERPVQILFAGKAHPQDVGGQEYAQEIFRQSQRVEFRSKVVLLADYDMHLGRALTSGVDVWLNNPLRPMEASGTSGMKPPLHGGLNFSILDGWWPEAFNGRNGWAIGGQQFKSRAKQDRYDADSLYDTLQTRIVPLFYERDRSGIPRRWVAMMKESIRSVGSEFNTHRMVGEYLERFYLPGFALLPPPPVLRGRVGEGAAGEPRSLALPRSTGGGDKSARLN